MRLTAGEPRFTRGYVERKPHQPAITGDLGLTHHSLVSRKEIPKIQTDDINELR